MVEKSRLQASTAICLLSGNFLHWPPVVCKWVDAIFMVFVYNGVQRVLTWWVAWRVFVRGRNRLTLASTWVQLQYLVGSVLLIFLVFCVVLFVWLSSSCVLCSQCCVLCTKCCHFLCIVFSWLLLWFFITFYQCGPVLLTEKTRLSQRFYCYFSLVWTLSTYPYMCKNHDSSYQLIVSCLFQVQKIRPMDTTPA